MARGRRRAHESRMADHMMKTDCDIVNRIISLDFKGRKLCDARTTIMYNRYYEE